jgi:hypothetical protein
MNGKAWTPEQLEALARAKLFDAITKGRADAARQYARELHRLLVQHGRLRPAAPEGNVCGELAPDRSGRSCDKPKGHDGVHWTYGGNTKTWGAAAPEQQR